MSDSNKDLAAKLSNENLTLDQKLALIDQALEERQSETKDKTVSVGASFAPTDPMDALQCEGCQ